MKKTKFTEAQIVAVLKRQECGIKVSDLCREIGISDATSPLFRICNPKGLL